MTTRIILAKQIRPIAITILALYLSFYGLYFALVACNILPDEAAEKLFSLLGVLLMPLSNAVILNLAAESTVPSAAIAGSVKAALIRASACAYRSWSRLLTAYISVSFIIVGWLAVTVIPVYALLMIAKIQPTVPLTILAVTVGTIQLTRFAFLDSFVVIGGLGPWAARQQSKAMSKGQRWQIMGYGLLLAGLPFVVETAGEAFAKDLGSLLGYQLGPLAPLLVSTATGFAATLLYVIPTIFFFVYWRDLTTKVGEPAATLNS